MNRLATLLTLVCFTFSTVSMSAQQPVAPAAETAALRAMVADVPLGSRIKLTTRAGKRMTATLLTISDSAIVVKRETRVPEPAQEIRYEEIERLQKDQGRGFPLAKAIGVGLAAGVGAILTLFAIAVSLSD